MERVAQAFDDAEDAIDALGDAVSKAASTHDGVAPKSEALNEFGPLVDAAVEAIWKALAYPPPASALPAKYLSIWMAPEYSQHVRSPIEYRPLNELIAELDEHAQRGELFREALRVRHHAIARQGAALATFQHGMA